MTYLRALVAIASMWAIGWLVLAVVHGAQSRLPRALAAGYAFGLGLSVCGLLAFVLSSAGVALPAEALALLAGLGGLASYLFRTRRALAQATGAAALFAADSAADANARAPVAAQASPSVSCAARTWSALRALPGRERAIVASLVALILGWSVVVLVLSLLEPIVEWDVLAIWAYKARVLAFESVRDTGYFQDVTRTYSHPDYPLLWPLAMRACWTPSGALDLVAVKLLGPAVFIALLLAACGRLAQAHAPARGLLFGAALSGLPMLQTQSIRLMADVPIAFLLFCLVVSVQAFIENRDHAQLRLASLLAAGVLFTKNEGIGFVGVLIVASSAALLFAGRRRDLPITLCWLGLMPALLTAPWFVFRLSIPKLHENLGSLAHTVQLSRVPTILREGLNHLLALEDWWLFWPLCAMCCAVGARALLRPSVAFVALTLVGCALLFGYVYVITPWDVAVLLDVSASRLALQVAPVALLLAHECCAAP